MNGAPRQLAVADFATPGEAKTAGFANGIRREIIVQHEMLAIIFSQAIDDLLVLARTQCCRHQGLGLATRKQGGTVRSGKDTDLGGNRSNRLGVATVNAATGFQDIATNDILLQALENIPQHLARQILV